MSKSLRSILIVAPVALCWCFVAGCTGDPDILLTTESNNCSIVGVVRNPQGPATAMLILGNETIAETTVNPATGRFVFNGLARGWYELFVTSGEWWGEVEEVLAESYRIQPKYVQLVNTFVEVADSDDGDTIRLWKKSANEKVILRFRAGPRVQFVSGQNRCRIASASLNSVAETVISDPNLYVYIPVDSMRKLDSLSATVYYRDLRDPAFPRTDSTCFKWVVDSSGYDSLASQSLVSAVRPRENSTMVSPEYVPFVVFNQSMDHGSVESAVSLEPAIRTTFSWAGDTVFLRPINPLDMDAVYTLVVGKGITTRDGVVSTASLHYSFRTDDSDFYTLTWPIDSAKGVSTVLPFEFQPRFSVDIDAFAEAFSITPAVDSLEIEWGYNHTILVRHAALECGTKYTIQVDSLLTSSRGIAQGTVVSIRFTTRERIAP